MKLRGYGSSPEPLLVQVKILTRLRGFGDSPEPLLVTYGIIAVILFAVESRKFEAPGTRGCISNYQ